MGIKKAVTGGVTTFAAGLVLLGAPVAASAAEPASSDDVGAMVCQQVDSRSIRLGLTTLSLEICDAGWRGVLSGTWDGDQLYLRSGNGTITSLRTDVGPQVRMVTDQVGNHGGPWKACTDLAGSAGEVCTNPSW